MLSEVSVEELDAARVGGATVIDVRESHEFAAGHVPGAQLFPLGLVPVRVQDLPQGAPVYVVCETGARSYQAAQLLHRAGHDARSVVGGTSAWARSGRPVGTRAPRA